MAEILEPPKIRDRSGDYWTKPLILGSYRPAFEPLPTYNDPILVDGVLYLKSTDDLFYTLQLATTDQGVTTSIEQDSLEPPVYGSDYLVLNCTDGSHRIGMDTTDGIVSLSIDQDTTYETGYDSVALISDDSNYYNVYLVSIDNAVYLQVEQTPI